MSDDAVKVIVPSTAKKVRQTVWFDPDVLRALKHEAIDRDLSLSELVEEAVRGRTRALWK